MMFQRREPVLVNEVAMRAVLPLENGNRSADDVIDGATEIVEEWLDSQSRLITGKTFSKLYGRPTDTSWTVSLGDFKVEVVEDPEQPLGSPYALRVMTPDEIDEARHWTIDVGLHSVGGRVFLDTSSACRLPASLRYQTPRSVPPFVSKIVERYGVRDAGYDVVQTAHPIRTSDECSRLVAAIRGERRLPIIAVSEPLALDPELLARRLFGVAHIVVVSVDASFELSRLIGQELSTFSGAVRTYRTPFAGGRDGDPFHPIALSRAIEAYVDRDGGPNGPAGFLNTLVNRAMRASVASNGGIARFDVDAFRTRLRANRRAAQRAAEPVAVVPPTAVENTREEAPPVVRSDAAPESAPVISEVDDLREQLTRALEANVSLTAQFEALETRVETVENDWFALLREHEQTVEKLRIAEEQGGGPFQFIGPLESLGLRSLGEVIHQLVDVAQDVANVVQTSNEQRAELSLDVDILRQRLAAVQARASALPKLAGAPTYPTVLTPDAAQGWIDANARGKLVLHPRALRALDEHVYGEVGEVYEVLDILANEYRAMRMRSADDATPRLVLEERLRTAGLRLTGSISETERGRFHSHYHVMTDDGERFLDSHIRNGGATADPVRCLRVYFFWDEKREQVVVGSLPSHLPNRLS